MSSSPDVSNSFVFLCSNSSVSQCGWWCPALHLSPLVAIHLSASLAGGVGLSACLQFICLPLKQSICLPVWLVSGSPDVSNSFVSPYSNSFVSQCGWVCPALRLSLIDLSPVSLYKNSFVSQSGWWCPALRMSPVDLFPLIASHLSPIVTGGVWLSGCLQFICPPFADNSFVSHCGWWCPALRLSPIDLSPLLAIYLSASLAGGVGLSACLQIICLPL